MWKSAISVHAYNLSTWKTEAEVCEFEGSLNYRAKSKRTKLSISGCLERVNQFMCCIYTYTYICVHIYICTVSIKKIIKTDFISLTKARKISNFPNFSWDIYH